MIASDNNAFLDGLIDRSTVARLPGFTRWLWDGVVPWKQGRGYATLALRQLLPAAAAQGLRYVEITTDPENIASQRVIVANGGTLIERFMKPKQHGGSPGLRYRIALT